MKKIIVVDDVVMTRGFYKDLLLSENDPAEGIDSGESSPRTFRTAVS
jgi:hypothetical protein